MWLAIIQPNNYNNMKSTKYNQNNIYYFLNDAFQEWVTQHLQYTGNTTNWSIITLVHLAALC